MRAAPTLIRDRDGKFGAEFDETTLENGVSGVTLPVGSPNLNAHVERFIQTLQVECLDRFIVIRLRHLDHLVSEFVQHYNQERPHSRIGFRTPSGPEPPSTVGLPAIGEIRCRNRLGGTLKHSFRRAA